MIGANVGFWMFQRAIDPRMTNAPPFRRSSSDARLSFSVDSRQMKIQKLDSPEHASGDER